VTELSDDLARSLSPETSWPAVIIYGEEGPGKSEGIWLPEVDGPKDVDGDDVETESRTTRQVSP